MKRFEDWDTFYLDFAELCADQSYDLKTRVGCVIVKNNNIISFSYNGTSPGTSNKMRDENGKTLAEVIHAETNAILKVAKNGVATKNATLYCTLCPCMECSKQILASGIKRVVFSNFHKSTEGIKYLALHGVAISIYANDEPVHLTPLEHCDLVDQNWIRENTGL